jgi:23S rRNA pseudouridine955/2504/2580 synthase/23S rRNA pseudouridine1911/1915/1917 synthase
MAKHFDIEPLYIDEDIIVANKPAGLLSIPDRFDRQLPSLDRLLGEKFGRIFVVHRLDRDTSGTIVFARNAAAHRDLSIQFEKHTIGKKYHVIVQGVVVDDEMDIDIPVMPNPAKKGAMMPSVRGKESLTRIRVLQRYRGATLLECDLKTGRQHQIRVHCSAIGHPLIIDPLYGDNDAFYVSSVKRRYNLKKGTEEQPLMSRISLHSYTIEFGHPLTNEPTVVTAEYPKDFKALTQVLRKYASTE